jgi:hypothetical protein
MGTHYFTEISFLIPKIPPQYKSLFEQHFRHLNVSYKHKIAFNSFIKIIKKDEIKAFATTELFLLDVRTSLIPFSTVVTKDYLAKEIKGELNAETRKRAEQEATLMTLLEIGEQVKTFLSKR